MELQEQITALQSDKNNLMNMVTNLNIEKIALDQSYVSSIKEVLELRKSLVMKDIKISELNTKIELLEKESLQKVTSEN
jgi:hypothetical protein